MSTSLAEIDLLLAEARDAQYLYGKVGVRERHALLYAIAAEIEQLGPELIGTAQAETNLPEARLKGEQARTVFQWRSYADALLTGNVLPIRIDTAQPDRVPAKPDLRKMYVPVGPVVVFCASNFPFAYSTAGGDTASALAAGCAVIVNAHTAHPKTSLIMATAISKAIQKMGFPAGLFAHVMGQGYENGAYLVAHPEVKAVGFTGSLSGGRALYDIAARRPDPIPVFAEMGSVNPVFLLPEKLANTTTTIAEQYVASLTLGVGQFCTNPGILVVQEQEKLVALLDGLAKAIADVPAAAMLHSGIAEAYQRNREKVLSQDGVQVLASATPSGDQGNAMLATVAADRFLKQHELGEEVFGPFGLIVICKSKEQMLAVARQIDGQLTCSLFGEAKEMSDYADLIAVISDKCGRLIFNGFPTGVEVAYAMQHGGPYPACTDSRFSSVGPDAIARFARPISYQGWPDTLLPEELKDANPLGIWRTVDGQLTKDQVIYNKT